MPVRLARRGTLNAHHAGIRAVASFRAPIPASPVLDANNAALVTTLSGSGSRICDMFEYGIPMYTAQAGDPTYNVTTVQTGWGPAPFANYNPIRIPDTAAPATGGMTGDPRTTGSDNWLNVIDPIRGLLFTMWQAYKVSGAWRCSWAGIYPINNVGNDSDVLAGFGNGAGMNVTFGLVTIAEMTTAVGLTNAQIVAQCPIAHPLVFSSDMGDPTLFRLPATKTDAGNWPNSFNPKLPQGARVQLDPSIDLTAIAGISKGELAIGRALQLYGAYHNDHGGSRMAFYFEGESLSDPGRLPPTKPGDPTRPGGTGVYYNAGLQYGSAYGGGTVGSNDYFGLVKLPWSNLRVLAAWDGR